jgi:hypothetical protein
MSFLFSVKILRNSFTGKLKNTTSIQALQQTPTVVFKIYELTQIAFRLQYINTFSDIEINIYINTVLNTYSLLKRSINFVFKESLQMLRLISLLSFMWD